MGSTAPSPAGSSSLLECQLAASAPVSASPSPMTHTATQVRVVQHRAVGVGQGVAELAALVDRARGVRRGVAGDAAGERELPDEPAHALGVAAHRRVDLAVGALQVGAGDHARPAVPGAADEDRVQVARADQPVDVRVDQVEPRGRAPVPEQPRLDVLGAQGLAQQRVVHQVDLPHGQVVGRPPPRVDQPQAVVVEPGRGRRRLEFAHPLTPFAACVAIGSAPRGAASAHPDGQGPRRGDTAVTQAVYRTIMTGQGAWWATRSATEPRT